MLGSGLYQCNYKEYELALFRVDQLYPGGGIELFLRPRVARRAFRNVYNMSSIYTLTALVTVQVQYECVFSLGNAGWSSNSNTQPQFPDAN